MKPFPKWMYFQAAVLVVLLITVLFLQNGWSGGMTVGSLLTLGFGALCWWLEES